MRDRSPLVQAPAQVQPISRCAAPVRNGCARSRYASASRCAPLRAGARKSPRTRPVCCNDSNSDACSSSIVIRSRRWRCARAACRSRSYVDAGTSYCPTPTRSPRAASPGSRLRRPRRPSRARFRASKRHVHAEKTKNPRPSERGLLHVACRSPALTADDRPRDQLPFAMRSWMCCARLADDGCELIIELWPPSICASFWKPVTRPFWLMPFCFIRSNE